jgi:hypothetical protein
MRDVSEAQEVLQEDGYVADRKEKNRQVMDQLSEETFSESNYNVFHKTDESDQCDIQSELQSRPLSLIFVYDLY